ncbi:MAG TPA: hypothetical protein PLK51_03620 [Bacteroidales bacterium]|nr:hypothetical protein [Bacteroidales bacterium]
MLNPLSSSSPITYHLSPHLLITPSPRLPISQSSSHPSHPVISSPSHLVSPSPSLPVTQSSSHPVTPSPRLLIYIFLYPIYNCF